MNQIIPTLYLGIAIISVIPIMLYVPNKIRAGTLYVSIRFTAQHKVFLLFAFFNIIILPFSFFYYKSQEIISKIDLYLFCMNAFLGVLILILGLTPFQFSEKGFFWVSLTKWEDIEDYYWILDRQTTLVLRKKWLFIFHRNINIAIPSTLKDEVEKVISERFIRTGAD